MLPPPDSFFSRRARRLSVLLAAVVSATLAAAVIDVGDTFPDLAQAGLSGTVPVTAHRVVLVDFWASWCAPCKASFPVYAQIHRDLASPDFALLAVSVDEDEARYRAFVKNFTPPFAVARDNQQQLVRMVDVPGMPTSYLVGRNGKVRFIHRGFHDHETDEALRREIAGLIAEKNSPP